MVGGPTRLHWAIALASLVGGIGGSFLAASIYSLGGSAIYGGGPLLLAGTAALYVCFSVGAVLGASGGAIVAFVVGRGGRARLGAFAGSLGGILLGALVGVEAETIAQSWVNSFSGSPSLGALVGALIAGLVAGVSAGGVTRFFADPRVPTTRGGTFAALLGAVLGMLGGLGGGVAGGYLAEAPLSCPNGYYANPFIPLGCSAGVTQEFLILGLWAGAIVGAASALATHRVLRSLDRP